MCLTILTLGGELTFSGRMRSGDRVGEKVGGTVGRRRGAWRGRWSTSGYLVTATRSNAPTSTKSYTQCRSQINMCQSPNRAFWTQLLNQSKHSGLSADLLRSALLITFPVNLHTPTVQYPCSAVSNNYKSVHIIVYLEESKYPTDSDLVRLQCGWETCFYSADEEGVHTKVLRVLVVSGAIYSCFMLNSETVITKTQSIQIFFLIS